MIEIQDLEEMDLEDVIEMLKQEEQSYEIYVPKHTRQFFSSNEDIAMDYADLAYSGQLLFDISTEFEYDEVSPHEHESVLFTIKVSDIELLATTLLHISYGYCNDHPDDPDFCYSDNSSDYLYQVEEGKIKNVACPYFIETSKEFMEDAEQDEDDENSETT